MGTKEIKKYIIPVKIPNYINIDDNESVYSFSNLLEDYIKTAIQYKLKFEIFDTIDVRDIHITDSPLRYSVTRLDKCEIGTYITGYDFNPNIREFYVEVSSMSETFDPSGKFFVRAFRRSDNNKFVHIFALDYVKKTR